MTDALAPGLTLDRDGRVGELLFDRPEKRNAISYQMWAAIPAAVAQIERDDTLDVLIVRGRGGTFCAGADISEFATHRRGAAATREYGARIEAARRALTALRKPSVAMIEGYCVGGGCEIALACDLRFAARDAQLGITPANLGIVYDFYATRQLVSVVGVSLAKYLLFSGALIDASRAREGGLVDGVFATDRLGTETRRFARLVASRSSVSVRSAKAIINKIAAGMDVADAEATSLPIAAAGSADYAEGVRAFLERRRPQFKPAPTDRPAASP